MASRTLVKNYLAQWMQMGKGISMSLYGKEVRIHKIWHGEKYSPQFDQLWQDVSSAKKEEAYLTGTHQSIGDLLDNHWDIIACARCQLLVPCLTLGARVPVFCPCDDIPNHPNLDLVMPHPPVALADRLSKLCDRIESLHQDYQEENDPKLEPNASYSSVEEDNQNMQNLKAAMRNFWQTDF